MSHSFVHSFLAVTVLLGLMFLNAFGLLHPVLDWGRVGVDFLASPIHQFLLKIRGFVEIGVRLKHLAAENEILSRQVEELTASLAALEKAKQENRFLREALGFQTEVGQNYIPAEVIGWDRASADQEIILNRGEKQGVKTGAVVVVAGRILVGMITKVFENTSQMELLTSSKIVVNAETVPEGAIGIVRGEHGLGLSFDLVSQTEVLKVGDKVITSGLSGQVPRALLIGEVGKIRSSESELFQKTSIIPATNLRRLNLVFIQKK